MTCAGGLILDSTGTVGVNEIVADEQLKIYPNPGNNYVHMHSSGAAITEITVINIAGMKVYHTETAAVYDAIVRTDSWPAGMYFIEVRSAAGLVVKKWLKDRDRRIES
jgi:hypothetical protein